MNETILKAVAETAKAKAVGQPRWINTIDRAIAGLPDDWIVAV